MTDVKIEQLEELRELLAKAGVDLPWELHDPDSGYLQIMGQPDGDADDMGRPQVTWPHLADIIDSGDYWAVGELIVAAVNALPALLDTLADLTRERDALLAEATAQLATIEKQHVVMVPLREKWHAAESALAGAIDVMKPVVDCWGIGWRPDQVQEMIRAMVPLVAAQRAFIADREAV